jgi:hypothetical protein
MEAEFFSAAEFLGPVWPDYLVPCTLYLAGFVGVCWGECCCVSLCKKMDILDIFPTQLFFVAVSLFSPLMRKLPTFSIRKVPRFSFPYFLRVKTHSTFDV